jgi:opacity protein-like surface antigen
MTKAAGFCALAVALLASGAALADGYGRGRVPAPIPVPAPMPIPETFTYYLRGDLGWSFVGSDPSFSETGSGNTLTSRRLSTDDVFFGGIGAGAYLSNRFRADITLDFLGDQTVILDATEGGGNAVRDRVRLRGTVGLANLYWDLLPRGRFTPYIGGGIGFVYNDMQRSYRETVSPGTDITGSSHDNNFGLAGALMAGVSISTDHRYAWDFSYRALYTDGGSTATALSPTTPPATSSVDIGGHWDHQFRVGLRVNLW